MSDTNMDANESDTSSTVETPATVNELLNNKNAAMAKADFLLSKFKSGKKFDRGEIVKVLLNFREIVRAYENISELVIQDLVIVDQRFANLEKQCFQLIQQMSTLTTALMNKGTLTTEDIQSTWEKDVKPKLEAQVKAVQDQLAKQEAANKSPLVDADGQEMSAVTKP